MLLLLLLLWLLHARAALAVCRKSATLEASRTRPSIGGGSDATTMRPSDFDFAASFSDTPALNADGRAERRAIITTTAAEAAATTTTTTTFRSTKNQVEKLSPRSRTLLKRTARRSRGRSNNNNNTVTADQPKLEFETFPNVFFLPE